MKIDTHGGIDPRRPFDRNTWFGWRTCYVSDVRSVEEDEIVTERDQKIGRRVRELRQGLGLCRMSLNVGLERAGAQVWIDEDVEAGRRALSVRELADFAEGFGCTVEDLTG